MDDKSPVKIGAPPELDEIVDEMQQRAAASSLLQGGRLSHLEATVWHFAEYVRARLRD